jgi:hypothetical protein
MLPHVPVSADRFRGNIFKKTSLINNSKFFFTKNSFVFLYKLNFLSKLSFFKNTLLLKNPQTFLNKQKQKTFGPTLTSLNSVFYLRSKITRLHKNLLFKKFHLLKADAVKQNFNTKKSKRAYLLKLENKYIRTLSTKLIMYKINFFHKKVNNKLIKRSRKKLKHSINNLNFSSLNKLNTQNQQLTDKLFNTFSYFLENKLNQNLESLKDLNLLHKYRRKYLIKLTHSTNMTHTAHYNNISLLHKHNNKVNPFVQSNLAPRNTLNLNSIFDAIISNKIVYTQNQILLLFLSNSLLLKYALAQTSSHFSNFMTNNNSVNTMQYVLNKSLSSNYMYTNLIPSNSFNKNLSKTVLNSSKNNFFQENIIS